MQGEFTCTRDAVERVNLTTGETTQIYSRITPGKRSTYWHDVDRMFDRGDESTVTRTSPIVTTSN